MHLQLYSLSGVGGESCKLDHQPYSSCSFGLVERDKVESFSLLLLKEFLSLSSPRPLSLDLVSCSDPSSPFLFQKVNCMPLLSPPSTHLFYSCQKGISLQLPQVVHVDIVLGNSFHFPSHC